MFTARYPGARPDEDAGRAPVPASRRPVLRLPAGGARPAARRRSYDVVLDMQNGVPFWAPAVHPDRRSSTWSTTCTASSGPRCSARSGPGSAGGWSPGSRRGSTGASALPRRLRTPPGSSSPSSASTRPGRCRLQRATSRCVGSDVRPAAHEPPSMVVLGRLVPHKRVELAIDALARLRERHPARLTVVGHGYGTPSCASYAERLGVDARGGVHRASSTRQASTACWPRRGSRCCRR